MNEQQTVAGLIRILRSTSNALNSCRMLMGDKESRDYAGALVKQANDAIAKSERPDLTRAVDQRRAGSAT